jgi:hypothetical protein
MSARLLGSMSWFNVVMTALWPMREPAPISMPPWSWKILAVSWAAHLKRPTATWKSLASWHRLLAIYVSVT